MSLEEVDEQSFANSNPENMLEPTEKEDLDCAEDFANDIMDESQLELLNPQTDFLREIRLSCNTRQLITAETIRRGRRKKEEEDASARSVWFDESYESQQKNELEAKPRKKRKISETFQDDDTIDRMCQAIGQEEDENGCSVPNIRKYLQEHYGVSMTNVALKEALECGLQEKKFFRPGKKQTPSLYGRYKIYSKSKDSAPDSGDEDTDIDDDSPVISKTVRSPRIQGSRPSVQKPNVGSPLLRSAIAVSTLHDKVKSPEKDPADVSGEADDCS